MNPTMCQGSTTMTSPESDGDGGDTNISKISLFVAGNNNNIGDGSTNKKKKAVAFGAIADEIFPVITKKSELTETEISELWYTKSDLEAAKLEIIETLSILRNGGRRTTGGSSSSSSSFGMKSKSSNNKGKMEICPRGLEMQTDRVRKFDAIRAVNAMFEEQKRQKSLGINDPDQLAKVYGAKAVFAEETALKMGRLDEEEAELALAELDKRSSSATNSSPTMSMFKNIKGRLRSLSPIRIRSSPMQSPKSVVLKLSTLDEVVHPPHLQKQKQRERPTKQKGRTLTPLRQRSMQKHGSTRSITDILSISSHRRKEQKQMMGRTSMDTV